MANSKRKLVEVCLNGLELPITIGKKAVSEGETTLTTISIRAIIDKVYEEKFEENILSIINKTDEYIGHQQLNDKLSGYLNSIDAGKFDIQFQFPFFNRKKLSWSNQKYLIKYLSKFSVSKTSFYNYSRKYSVEIPVISKEYIIPGIYKDILEIPAKIFVELEGTDVYFIEDVIDLVEQQFYSSNYNPFVEYKEDPKFILLEKIENKLYNRFNIEKCSATISSKKGFYSYSAKLSSYNYKLNNNFDYQTEHIFI